jgi:lipopolysaccharide/colanic/teichoic acid biosynthesis glycosyltransferase
VRPGITGLWQVRGRSALDFDEMLSLDVGYVRLWSLKLDITILAETIPAVFRGRGAC